VAPRRPATPRSVQRAAARTAQRPAGRTGRVGRPEHRPAAGSRRPAAAARGRRPGPVGRLPRALSLRTAVMVGVCLLGLLSVVAPVRAWVDQQSDLTALRAEVEAREARVGDLQAEAARWDDPAHVSAQARERLHYLYPGETGYRVVDAPPVAEPSAATAVPEPAEPPSGVDRLWRLLGDAEAEAP